MSFPTTFHCDRMMVATYLSERQTAAWPCPQWHKYYLKIPVCQFNSYTFNACTNYYAPSLRKCEMSWKWEGPAQLKIRGFETHSPTVKPIVLPAKRKLILLKILGLLIVRTSRFETHCPPNETHSPPNANSLSSKRRGSCCNGKFFHSGTRQQGS